VIELRLTYQYSCNSASDLLVLLFCKTCQLKSSRWAIYLLPLSEDQLSPRTSSPGGYPDSAVCLWEGPHRIHRDQAPCISLFVLHLFGWSARRSLHWHYVVSIKPEFTVKSNHLHYCTKSEEGKRRWGYVDFDNPRLCVLGKWRTGWTFSWTQCSLPWVHRGCGCLPEKCQGAVDIWPPSSGNLLGM